MAQEGAAAAAVEAVLLACLLQHRNVGLAIWRGRPWRPPPLAASGEAKVGAQPLAVCVFGSHGGSADRSALLPGSVPAPGSGTQCDARVKPGVNKECGSLLPMWRDAVRSLSIDAAAYDYVLGALSINATARVYGASWRFRLRLAAEVWRRCRLFGIGRWVTLFTPHIDVARVRHWFGEVNGLPQISRLLQVPSPGASVGVAPGGDLQAEITYGNRPSSESHTGAIRANIVQDVVNGRALVFKRSSVSDICGVRVSPLGAAEGRKLCINHDLTFAGHGYRSSVNDDTDFSAAPPCELGHVFGDVSRRIMYLRQRHGVVARVMCRIDVKDAFLQIPVEVLHAAKFGYVFDEHAVVDLFLRFRWRSSPGL